MSSKRLPAGLRHRLGSAVLLIAAFAATLRAFEFRWHRSALEDLVRQPGGWAGALLIVVCSAMVHELLHALGWIVFAGVSWRSISIRPTWEVMGFATRVDVEVTPGAHRLALALPAIVLGCIPILAGFGSGNGLVVLWGLFFLLECFADLVRLLSRSRQM